MPQAQSASAATVRLLVLGKRLRELREAADCSLEDAATALSLVLLLVSVAKRRSSATSCSSRDSRCFTYPRTCDSGERTVGPVPAAEAAAVAAAATVAAQSH